MESEVGWHGGLASKAIAGACGGECEVEAIVGRYLAGKDRTHARKKMVRPAQRRGAGVYRQSAYRMRQRRACRLALLSRKAAAYPAVARNDGVLKERLKERAERYPRYGDLMLHALLKAEGLVVNRKRTYRLYTALGMPIRTRRRKKRVRARIPMALPTRMNERWSLDFVHDPLANSRRIRVLNIIDDFSRQCVGQRVDTSLSGVRLARYLDELAMTRHCPTRSCRTMVRN